MLENPTLKLKNENSLFLIPVTESPPVSNWVEGGKRKREVGKEKRKKNFKFFQGCDSLSFSSLECHKTFLSIHYSLLGRKRLIA